MRLCICDRLQRLDRACPCDGLWGPDWGPAALRLEQVGWRGSTGPPGPDGEAPFCSSGLAGDDPSRGMVLLSALRGGGRE